MGRLDIKRDWGWAPEYVEAMWKMLRQREPEDFVIATGETYALQDFVTEAFAVVNLNWREHVDSGVSLMRPTDLKNSYANPSHANVLMGWVAKTHMLEVVKNMMAEECRNLTTT